MPNNSRKRWARVSFICFLIGIVVWVPNIAFEQGYGYWFLTFIVGPAGVLFGYLGKSKLAIILNLMIALSFFIIMFLGYLVHVIFNGQP